MHQIVAPVIFAKDIAPPVAAQDRTLWKHRCGLWPWSIV